MAANSDPLLSRPAPTASLAVPDAPEDVQEALRAMEEAVRLVTALHESPESPDGGYGFEACRREYISDEPWEPKAKPAVVESTVTTPVPDNADGLVDDSYDPDEPNVNYLVAQAWGVLRAMSEAEIAYEAVATEVTADAPPDGCAFRTLLGQLRPYSTLCADLLGLEPDCRPRFNVPPLEVGGRLFGRCGPRVSPAAFGRRCLALPPVDQRGLSQAQEQVARVGVRGAVAEAVSRISSFSQNRTKRKMTVEEADQRMRELCAEDLKKYEDYTSHNWATVLNCSPTTVTKTEMWELLEMTKASRKQRQQEHLNEDTDPRGKKYRDRLRRHDPSTENGD